ncbi:hypothetical protein M408DRAFT_7210 [Serendipita vermifera MAFF 305830]|uniref:Uncharacterized protein n=1 Tax=Serendipita vermifera MAFF 305830 TaxID=933852 RepID=A0A0C2XRA0_SERVB|nr:hypothetical protein M408DRAFT_7210 [Serendipita vermifera MAFF 305830]
MCTCKTPTDWIRSLSGWLTCGGVVSVSDTALENCCAAPVLDAGMQDMMRGTDRQRQRRRWTTEAMKEGDDGDVCIPVGVRIEAAPGLACQIETGIRSHWACQKELNNNYYSVLILRHYGNLLPARTNVKRSSREQPPQGILLVCIALRVGLGKIAGRALDDPTIRAIHECAKTTANYAWLKRLQINGFWGTSLMKPRTLVGRNTILSECQRMSLRAPNNGHGRLGTIVGMCAMWIHDDEQPVQEEKDEATSWVLIRKFNIVVPADLAFWRHFHPPHVFTQGIAAFVCTDPGVFVQPPPDFSDIWSRLQPAKSAPISEPEVKRE